MRPHWQVLLLASAYLALALSYGFVNPLWEATDEVRHFRYIRYLQVFHVLPEQTTDPARNAQAHHPPVYYLVAAIASAWVPTSDADPVFFDPPINPHWGFRYYEVGVDNKAQFLHGPEEAWPYHGNFLIAWIARWLSMLFGLAVVILTHRIGREAFPDRPALAFGAAAFVAFNPNFLHTSSKLWNLQNNWLTFPNYEMIFCKVGNYLTRLPLKSSYHFRDQTFH